MKHHKIIVSFFFLITICIKGVSQINYSTDVLVVGGGTAGVAAGIQSARLQVKTIIAEETSWLGGMITAAGVSAFDGNHNLPSGIWAEFRDNLYKAYGGAKKVETGWVSNTLFEPHVGDSILKKMIANTPHLQVLYHHQFIKTIVKGNQIVGAEFSNCLTGARITIFAKQVIDATELSDVMANARVPYNIGMEANSLTGEDIAVTQTNDIIQDLTYVAILKDYGIGKDCTIVKPDNYDSAEFDCCCNEFCSDSNKLTSNVTAQKMLNYGKLPNGKYMINWPSKGNDFYLNVIELSAGERTEQLKKAKEKTLRFVYFIQTKLGYKQLGLADDEYPTSDHLPLIPYHRESRRLDGVVRFKVQDIANPFQQKTALYRTGVAVGDYPIDHHHRQNPLAPQHLSFYPVPSFTIPLGALIPKYHKGLIVAEKGISVSNLINGSTRLQPCVMLTGQAAGVLAALCVQQKKSAIEIEIRQVQAALINANAYILPYFDLPISHPHFAAIQRIGATGFLKGKGIPYKWANQTWFYPDSTIKTSSLIDDYKSLATIHLHSDRLTIADAITLIMSTAKVQKITPSRLNWNVVDRMKLQQQLQIQWPKWKFTSFDTNRLITRLEFSVMLDSIVHPFEILKVDHHGFFKKP